MVYNDEQGGVVGPDDANTYKTVDDLFFILSAAYFNNCQLIEVSIQAAT